MRSSRTTSTAPLPERSGWSAAAQSASVASQSICATRASSSALPGARRAAPRSPTATRVRSRMERDSLELFDGGFAGKHEIGTGFPQRAGAIGLRGRANQPRRFPVDDHLADLFGETKDLRDGLAPTIPGAATVAAAGATSQ